MCLNAVLGLDLFYLADQGDWESVRQKKEIEVVSDLIFQARENNSYLPCFSSSLRM